MANRITIYGKPTDPDIKRLRREMNAMYVEYSLADPAETRSQQRFAEAGITKIAKPIVEVQREDDNGSVYLTNPDEPTLRQALMAEGILSITSYWV